MPRTPVTAFGLLEMEYEAYGKPHQFRCYVHSFLSDAGVGTFSSAGTPASLDALSTELTTVMKPLYSADSDLGFGAWRGLFVTSETGSAIPVVEGLITQDTTPAYNTSPNSPQAVSQMTASYRDAGAKIVKEVLIGSTYAGPNPYKYSQLGGGYLAFVNYVLGSTRIISRAGVSIVTLVDMSFDTNDGLTRRYRR